MKTSGTTSVDFDDPSIVLREGGRDQLITFMLPVSHEEQPLVCMRGASILLIVLGEDNANNVCRAEERGETKYSENHIPINVLSYHHSFTR